MNIYKSMKRQSGKEREAVEISSAFFQFSNTWSLNFDFRSILARMGRGVEVGELFVSVVVVVVVVLRVAAGVVHTSVVPETVKNKASPAPGDGVSPLTV